jgi:hypothetical protein
MPILDCGGNLSPAMRARNQVCKGLSYRPASLRCLATQFKTRFLDLSFDSVYSAFDHNFQTLFQRLCQYLHGVKRCRYSCGCRRHSWRMVLHLSCCLWWNFRELGSELSYRPTSLYSLVAGRYVEWGWCTGPPGWRSIPGLLKRFTNLGSVREFFNFMESRKRFRQPV